jgi:hypothetical protein
MSRRFWGAVMLVSLVTTAGGAAFLYKTLIDKSTVTAPLKPVPSAPAVEPVEKELTSEEHQKISDDTAASQQKSAPIKLRNIQFVYINSAANNVFLVGNFDEKGKSVKKAMEKNRNKWTVTLKLEPGNYEYTYLVNGKNVRDPYNKKTSNGKSLLTVKPLPSN